MTKFMGKGSDRPRLSFAALLRRPITCASGIIGHLVEGFCLTFPMLNKSNEQVMRGNLYNVFWWIRAHAFGASIVAFI